MSLRHYTFSVKCTYWRNGEVETWNLVRNQVMFYRSLSKSTDCVYVPSSAFSDLKVSREISRRFPDKMLNLGCNNILTYCSGSHIIYSIKL